MLGNRHTGNQLLTELVVNQMIAGYPPHLEALRVFLFRNYLQFDLNPALVLQRQLVGQIFRLRFDDTEFRRNLVIDRAFQHLQDVRRLEFRTYLGQFDLERTRVLVR